MDSMSLTQLLPRGSPLSQPAAPTPATLCQTSPRRSTKPDGTSSVQTMLQGSGMAAVPTSTPPNLPTVSLPTALSLLAQLPLSLPTDTQPTSSPSSQTVESTLSPTAADAAVSRVGAICNPAKGFWSGLSAEEKTASTGERYAEKRLRQYAWEPCGPLYNYYSQKVEPLLDSLYESNTCYIYKKSGTPVYSSRCWELYLLSAEDDPVHAQPIILVRSKDKHVARRIKETFLTNGSFKRLNSGFAVKYERKWSLFMAGSTSGVLEVESRESARRSLCGTKVLVSPNPDHDDPKWRQTTLGLIICLEGRFYAVTVAHCYMTSPSGTKKHFPGDDRQSYDDQSSMESSGDTEQSDDDSIDSITESGEGPESSAELAHSVAASTGSMFISEDDKNISPFWVYRDLATNVIGPAMQSGPVEGSHSSVLALIGRLNPLGKSIEGGVGPVCVSLANDWALVEILDPMHMRPNEIQMPSGDKVMLTSINLNTNRPHGKAYIAAPSSGVQEVKIFGTVASIVFPWTNMIQKAWTIEFTLKPGDSGAWVFSENGRLFGMAVSTVVDYNISYVLRAEDLFRAITNRFSFDEDLDDNLPLTSFCDTRSRHHGKEPENTEMMPLYVSAARNSQSKVGAPSLMSCSSFKDSGYSSRQPNADIREAEVLLSEEVQLLESQKRLSPAALNFTEIMAEEYLVCKEFVLRCPEVVAFENLHAFQSEGILAYSDRRMSLTRVCIERSVIISDLLNNYDLNSKLSFTNCVESYFEPLVAGRENEMQAFYRKNDQVLEVIKKQGHKLRIPRTSQLPRRDSDFGSQSGAHTTVGKVELNSRVTGTPECGSHASTGLETLPQSERHDISKGALSVSESRKDRIFPSAEPMKPKSKLPTIEYPKITPISYVPDVPPLSNSQKVRFDVASECKPSRMLPPTTNLISSRNGKEGLYNGRYRLEKSTFFSSGRVFAMVWHEYVGSGVSGGLGSWTAPSFTGGRYSERISTTIRKMVVVKPLHGYCWCVPIVTYGGKGTLKPGLSEAEVGNHTAIHMVGTPPNIPPEEIKRGMSKLPIAVEPAEEYEKLDPSSRIFFGKVYSIEQNVQVQNVGHVCGKDLMRLQEYFSQAASGAL